ncbi:hypothetical protein [Embleya sp. NPDC001921]
MTAPMSEERLAEIRAMRWTETSRHFARDFRDEDEKFLWVHGAAYYNARVEAVAEIDRLRSENERLRAAAEMPGWVRETTHVVVEQRGGRVITASGLDLQDWWRTGRIGEVFDDYAAEPCHITDVGLFHLYLTYVDGAGAYWEHRGDWQYDEPLMLRVDEPGGPSTSVPEFLADVLARGPLTPAPRPAPASEAPA